jgi:hypothetical protein
MYFDHPDFSILTDPEAPSHWRGVAKTQKGIKALLALWGSPLDDPGHPLCLFSWQPTSEALAALNTAFSDAVAIPFLNTTEHRTVWDAQKSTAWLSKTDAPATMTVDVIDTGPPAPMKAVPRVWPLEAPTFPLTVKMDDTAYRCEGPRNEWRVDTYYSAKGFLWGDHEGEYGLFSRQFRIPDPEKAKALRKALMSSGAPHCLLENTLLGCAYFGAKEGFKHWPPVSLRTAYMDFRFNDRLEPWEVPLFVQAVRAFVDAPETPVLRDAFRVFSPYWASLFNRTLSDCAPEALDALCYADVSEEVHVALWEVCPLSVLRAALDEGFFVNEEHALGVIEASFFSDDRVFLSRLRDVDWERGRGRLDQTTEGGALYRLWDRFEGFEARDTPDGLERFASSFVKEDFERPFLEMGPPRVKAFLEDPTFWEGVKTTDFWERLSCTPDAHPQWQAVHERFLLSDLLMTPKARGSCLSA